MALIFEVEVVETITWRYRVQAESEAEAVSKVDSVEVEPHERSTTSTYPALSAVQRGIDKQKILW